MANRPLNPVLRHLRRLTGMREASDVGDGQLLERFARQKDEAAFTALVERHGPMVLGVCRRVLWSGHDVEDAFQATFLVLVRKAGSLCRSELVGNWLYGVAERTARRARATAARRRERESLDEVADIVDETGDVEGRDLRLVLDEELSQLPDKYRRPLVLCYLEGHTHEEAAARLRCPKGTFQTRLSRGRERLRERLLRRGLTLTASSLAAALAPEALAVTVPPALTTVTVRAALHFAVGGTAAGIITSQTAVLAEGVLQAMLMTKLKIAAAVLLTVGLAGSGAAVFAYQAARAGDGEAAAKAPTTRKAPTAALEKADKASNADAAATENGDRAAGVHRLLETLQSPQSKFNGFDDPKTTLQEALQTLTDRYDVAIQVNEPAFQNEQLADVLNTPIAERPLMPMKNSRLEAVLNKLLQRVPAPSGAMFVLRGDHIEITTIAAVRAEVGVPEGRPLLPLVHVPSEARALEKVLQDLARQSGYNVVLDPRSADKGATLIKANLSNVPIDNAVRLIADMADLKMVQMGNILYVTTAENAAKWEKLELSKPVSTKPTSTSGM